MLNFDHAKVTSMKTLSINRLILAIGIPALIIMVLFALTKTELLIEKPTFGAFAISFDLLITVPCIYYIIIRNSKISPLTLFPMVIATMVIATLILPRENQYYLDLFKRYAIPLIELGFILLVIRGIRRSVRSHQMAGQIKYDFYSVLQLVCYDLLPKRIAGIFITELAVIYYGLIQWKQRPIQSNEFTYHKSSGTPAMMGMVMCILAVETFATHLLIAKWNGTAAWILTGLSGYVIIQLLGFIRSLSKRPMFIMNNILFIRYGILAEVSINIDDINSVEFSNRKFKDNHHTRKLSAFGNLESHNVIIKLKNPYTLSRIYGIKKQFTELVLLVDDKQGFKHAIEAAK